MSMLGQSQQIQPVLQIQLVKSSPLVRWCWSRVSFTRAGRCQQRALSRKAQQNSWLLAGLDLLQKRGMHDNPAFVGLLELCHFLNTMPVTVLKISTLHCLITIMFIGCTVTLLKIHVLSKYSKLNQQILHYEVSRSRSISSRTARRQTWDPSFILVMHPYQRVTQIIMTYQKFNLTGICGI